MPDVSLRFRHQNGDVGPFSFSTSTTLQAVKEKVLAEWPKEGAMVADGPSQIADIRLLIGGKFVENSKAISDYSLQMGDTGGTVTIHCLIRKASTPAPAKKGPSAKEDPKVESSDAGCTCTIS